MLNIPLSQATSQAQKIAKTLKGGEVFALIGELGSGKTTFTKSLGKALGIKNTITSPTFVLMQEYKTTQKSKNNTPLWLYHLDLYRAKNFNEIKTLGIEEIWNRPETITVIEWADKITKNLPPKTITLKFVRDVN
jgi:tRNA threonylcarbamoyladenosine biosynthesis protein TsaE